MIEYGHQLFTFSNTYGTISQSYLTSWKTNQILLQSCGMPVLTGSLRWRHNGCDSVSNHQPRECLLRRLIRRTSKKTSKLHVTGLCAGNSPETGEFPAQMASNAENVSIWWRHHGIDITLSQRLMKQCRLHCEAVIATWGVIECISPFLLLVNCTGFPL